MLVYLIPIVQGFFLLVLGGGDGLVLTIIVAFQLLLNKICIAKLTFTNTLVKFVNEKIIFPFKSKLLFEHGNLKYRLSQKVLI